MVVCVAIGVVGPAASDAADLEKPAAAPTDRVEDFTLQDFRGKRVSLSAAAADKMVVLVFLGTECPLAKLYAPRLAALAREFEPQGVAFLAINSNCQDSVTEMASYARRYEVVFPLLKDVGNRVADQLSAERTPEAFLLDRDRRIRYRGRIDDQYGVGYSREKPKRQDLRIAIEELLAGKPVSLPETEAVGCIIGRVVEPKKDSHVTYSNQIARIFQKHCIECHRDGQIAPFALDSYDEAAGWAETIAEVIRDQRMPPWHADPRHGRYVNQRLMTSDEKQLVYQWVADGAPQGDPSDLPPPREFVDGWRLPREPEAVLAMRDFPYEVPAEGTVEYQYFVVDPGFAEDKWIAAAEVVPGNRSVVHHAIVFVRPPDGVEFRGFGWLAAYVPGQGAFTLKEGRARRIPAGSKLVFQMHYTPTGSPQTDITKIGLVFAQPETVTEEVITMMSLNRKFEIPPQVAGHRVTSSLERVPPDGKLLAMAPHMHLRGKSFRFAARRGNDSQVLLDVPRYDFNWQHAYALAEPLPLTDVDAIDCVATFDNSEDNLANPDPSATVHWGDQTWEEMMVGFLEVAVPAKRTALANPPPASATSEEAQAKARDFVRRFDQDGDQVVARNEVPEAFRVFAFRRFDANGDKRITLDEAEKQAAESLEKEQRRLRDRRRFALE